jgi:chromosome segregation ATPase
MSKGDKRRDDDPEGAPVGLLVDRVFAPTRRTPKPASATAEPNAEVSLRHQVSRLQRELNEAQRKLADHDDELAAESLLRRTVTSAHHALVDEHEAQARALAEERLARQLEARAAESLRARAAELEAHAATLAARLARLEADHVALAPVHDKLAEMTTQFTRLGAENGLLGQRLSAAVMTVDALTQETRKLRERAVATMPPAAPASRAPRPDVDDDLGEEELRILYGDT